MLYTMDFGLIFHLRFSIPDIKNTNDRDILYKECQRGERQSAQIDGVLSVSNRSVMQVINKV